MDVWTFETWEHQLRTFLNYYRSSGTFVKTNFMCLCVPISLIILAKINLGFASYR